MKTVLTAATAIALAAALSAPALAQQAGDQATVKHSGGQCAVSQAMLQAVADAKQQRMDETKAKIDLLIENALATARTPRASDAPVVLGKSSPQG